jgi:Na+/H+-dicarboxylate symporter
MSPGENSVQKIAERELPQRRKLSASQQILIGLGAGIGTGLFFGERVSFLNWPARGFVSLLQITVLPYIVGPSLLGST